MVEVIKTIPTDVVVAHQCDICKKLLRHHVEVDDDQWDDVVTLKGNFGYFSSKDLQRHNCDMCEACYDKVREFIEVVLGGKIQVHQDWFDREPDGPEQIRYEDLEKTNESNENPIS